MDQSAQERVRREFETHAQKNGDMLTIGIIVVMLVFLIGGSLVYTYHNTRTVIKPAPSEMQQR